VSMDVLSAWAVRSEEQPLLGWKKDSIKLKYWPGEELEDLMNF
jgi:hypothetical protein